jgi:hypothetical protein
MKQCLEQVPFYENLAILFFYKCGDNDTSVATFVANLLKTLDTAGLEPIFNTAPPASKNDA